MGLSPGLSRPIEIIFNPCASTGRISRSLSACGCSSVPSMIGTLGPYTSASSKPTEAPSRLSARARLTATVVFPTPPFPLATATRFFTPWMGNLGGWGMGGGGMVSFSWINRI